LAGVEAAGLAGALGVAGGCCARADEIIKAAIDVVAIAMIPRATGRADAATMK
jgi:hypothetical protein